MKTKEVAKQETVSSRFIKAITKEFMATAGDLPSKFDTKKKHLSQHLYIAMDTAMQALEKRRLDKGPKNNPEIIWQNVNMSKLAIDAMHRIELGLDALIPNHISIIPYFNGRSKQYDVDLRIGYVGADYYRRKMAVETPVDIIYELVHETDKFTVIKKSIQNDIESYEFEITEPFKRGKVIGGFGYIVNQDPKLNKLVLVSEDDFLESKKYAQTNKFWITHANAMRYKTLVHRTTAKLRIDPDKVSPAYAVIEAEESLLNVTPEEQLENDIMDRANKTEIDVKPEPPDTAQQKNESAQNIPPQPKSDELSDAEKAEIEAAEAAGPDF